MGIDSIADALLQTVLDWEEWERSETVTGIRLGLAAGDAGRVRPIADFAEAMRAKYDLPAHLTDAEPGAEVILP